MPDAAPIDLRERKRRAVQTELAAVAQDLFIRDGYEETTVDDIAAAAGISRRSFFRYFASKEDLVVGKHELFGERIAEAFDARPLDEPLWVSLRRSFDVVVEFNAQAVNRRRADAMRQIIERSPTLKARVGTGRFVWSDQLASRVAARLAAPRKPDPKDPRAAAIVGSALACLQAANDTWAAAGRKQPFASVLDAAMGAVADVPGGAHR